MNVELILNVRQACHQFPIASNLVETISIGCVWRRIVSDEIPLYE